MTCLVEDQHRIEGVGDVYQPDKVLLCLPDVLRQAAMVTRFLMKPPTQLTRLSSVGLICEQDLPLALIRSRSMLGYCWNRNYQSS